MKKLLVIACALALGSLAFAEESTAPTAPATDAPKAAGEAKPEAKTTHKKMDKMAKKTSKKKKTAAEGTDTTKPAM